MSVIDTNIDSYEWNHGYIDGAYHLAKTRQPTKNDCAAQCEKNDECKAVVYHPTSKECMVSKAQPGYGGIGYRNEATKHGNWNVAMRPPPKKKSSCFIL